MQILMLIDQINKYSSRLGSLNPWDGRSTVEGKAKVIAVTLACLQEKEPHLTHDLVAVRMGLARDSSQRHTNGRLMKSCLEWRA